MPMKRGSHSGLSGKHEMSVNTVHTWDWKQEQSGSTYWRAILTKRNQKPCTGSGPNTTGFKVKINDEGGQNCTWRGLNTFYRSLFKCYPFHLTPRRQVVMYLIVICANEAWKPLGFKRETYRLIFIGWCTHKQDIPVLTLRSKLSIVHIGN